MDWMSLIKSIMSNYMGQKTGGILGDSGQGQNMEMLQQGMQQPIQQPQQPIFAPPLQNTYAQLYRR